MVFIRVNGPLFLRGMDNNRYRRKLFMGKGGMNEVGCRGLAHSPDSDCNSNHPGSASVLSNTSSQDIDFVQDNSDYQWFVDYGYRDNHHTSILSLPDSYEAGDIGYYETLAKNMDANLAEADIESFRTEDIHALLTNLPPMCTDHLSQECHRQGESYASVSGSMMGKFDFDSSMSPHSSSQGEDSANSTSMSICKSELLFSPVKETPMPGANYSVDSLDCELLNEHDIMLTCQANKDNYTIAFEGSVTMYSEDSDYHYADKSETSGGGGSTHWSNDLKHRPRHLKIQDSSMSQSDSGSFTTWSNLKKRNSDNHLQRHPSGNNNHSGDETTHYDLSDSSLKSQSMPNLYKQKLRGLLTNNYIKSQNLSNSSAECCTTIKRKPVKVFDIQHQVGSSSGSGASMISDMATSIDGGSSTSEHNNKPNFNLVRLFMKQKSMSAEGMSTGLDHSSASENWPAIQSGDSNISEKHTQHERLEDSLFADQKSVELYPRTYDSIIEEEESRSESAEHISVSMKSETNVNNNNSAEYDEAIKRKLKSRSTTMKRNNSLSSSSSNSSFSKKIHQVPMHLMNKSIQTSTLSEIKNVPYKLNCSHTKESIRVIEPSFLSKLKREGEVEKPVYILYPNYVLPDLDFLNQKEEVAKVYLVPQKPKPSTKTRPFSCNDVEALKRKGFNHVRDWDSLNFLLPNEYRQILSDVPEVAQYITKEKPAFSKTKTRTRPRPISCDCTTNISSSSSTATQPSSGYRGSSSILTDSQNSPAPTTNFNPLFVYRYDSVTSSEASLLMSERQRSITTAPPLPKRSISLSQEQKPELVPPRPPLPRGILRKGIENKLKQQKRYSVIDINKEDILDDVSNKRHSLQEPYFVPRHKRLSETEDEGVDAGTSSSSLDEHFDNSPIIKHDVLFSNISTDELAQLEEFLKMSGISTSDHDDINEESVLQLRSYVSKFLSLKINQDPSKKCVSFAEKVNVLPKTVAPNNSPNVSALLNQKHSQGKTLVDMPICEEGESTPENYASPQHKINPKNALISGVNDAVEKIISHFSLATNQIELNSLGDSAINPTCAKLALTTLCPALYAILSDGLKPSLETSFGAIGNSVWQVVEASAQQGPLTKALNELVMRINGEDVITEGLVKFNAFVFGLLNVRSLDAWFSYLRTRESILRKHYSPNSLLIMSHTGGAGVRALLDRLVAALQPLALLPFQFDLLFEYRQLHDSLKRMDSYHQPPSPTQKTWKPLHSTHSNLSHSSDTEEVSTATAIYTENKEPSLPDLLNSSAYTRPSCRSDKQRPRSCADASILSRPTFKLGEDRNSALKKRWSGINLSSKLYQAYSRLAHDSEEEYTDSLENQHPNSEEDNTEILCDGPESIDSNISDDKPLNGKKFKKLQKRWEMLSGKESLSPPESPTHNKSKIPRLVASPVKPSGIPVLVSPTSKTMKSIPKKIITPPNGNKKGLGAVSKTPTAGNLVKNSPAKKGVYPSRTSRLDQLENTPEQRHPTRPSSLPYKPIAAAKNSKITPPRRAVSTSVNRKPTTQSQIPKVVRTLSHRLPSESGHLSYNEGERLKLVLEVDEKWLLCCRGTQKGLVPRSAVIADTGRF